MNALDLALSIRTPDGVLKRWGADEAAVGDVPKGLSFSTSDPGGFKDASLSLSRLDGAEASDLALLNDTRIYGPGNVTRWEGRLQEKPSHSGDEDSVNPGAVGWAAHLDDDPSFSEIYIDRDLSHWGNMSLQRRANLAAVGILPEAFAAAVGFQDAGVEEAGINFACEHLSAAGADRGEQFYYGGGVDLGEVRYDFHGHGVDTDWLDRAQLCVDDVATGEVFGTDHDGNPSVFNAAVTATVSGKKYAFITTQYGGAASGDFANINHRWTKLRVKGRHGLTPAYSSTGREGFLACDVIADVVRRAAPLLNFTTGTGGSIAPSEWPIPHLVFMTQCKGSDAILGTNAYHQRSWGVYDNKKFFWLPTSTFRKRWRIRRSRGDQVDLLGPQAENAINGVVVTFTDFGGVTRVLAPPGATYVYGTSPLLADTSPTNPVNAAGIPRKWAELQLSFQTDAVGAIQIAREWMLDKLQNAQARGSIVVTGWVEDEYGVFHPASAMRACDSATVVDGDNIERRIIETNHDHDSHTTTANMDASPHTIEAQQERMGVVLVGVTD